MAESVPSELLNAVTNFLQETCRILNCSSLRIDEVEHVLERIASSELMLNMSSNPIDVDPMVFHALAQAKHRLSNISSEEGPDSTHIQTEMIFSGDRGRPSSLIGKEHLEFFLSYGFHCPEISQILGVSESTLRRRLNQFGLYAKNFSQIIDRELDAAIEEIKINFPDSGYRMVLGQLRAKDIRVQEHRVHESLRRVDTDDVILRTCALRVIRRRYKVSGPNALWHVDTNHKLIR